MIIQVLSRKSKTELPGARWESAEMTLSNGDEYLLILRVTDTDMHRLRDTNIPGVKFPNEKEAVFSFTVVSVKKIFEYHSKIYATVIGISAPSASAEALFQSVYSYQDSLSGTISD